MECKYLYDVTEELSDAVLIETLWNVNFCCPAGTGAVSAVLIETLWNVNTKEQAEKAYIETVLIETLWNVNSGVKVVAFTLIPY